MKKREQAPALQNGEIPRSYITRIDRGGQGEKQFQRGRGGYKTGRREKRAGLKPASTRAWGAGGWALRACACGLWRGGVLWWRPCPRGRGRGTRYNWRCRRQ